MHFDSKTDEVELVLKNEIEKVNTFPVSMMLHKLLLRVDGALLDLLKRKCTFGQWTWKKNEGLSPKNLSFSNFSVKSFKNLQHSVNSYILNLNTHKAYAKLRNYRKLMKNYNNFKGKKFSKYLDKYAEIGFRYVLKINKIIEDYDLEIYNNLAFIQRTN